MRKLNYKICFEGDFDAEGKHLLRNCTVVFRGERFPEAEEELTRLAQDMSELLAETFPDGDDSKLPDDPEFLEIWMEPHPDDLNIERISGAYPLDIFKVERVVCYKEG